MTILTIITPTYNRVSTLKKCWESLCKQSNKKFQWLIIDDGSTDMTQQLVEHLKNKTVDFEIDYYVKPNGGKHTALNYAHSFIKGEYVMILDSDDILTTDAVDTVASEWKKIADNSKIAGITFMKSKADGIPLAKMPVDRILSDHIEFRVNRNINGDCCETLRTSAFKQYRFPEISGEKFLGEGMLWTTLALSYCTLYINQVIYIAPQYLSTGLTMAGRKMRLQNLKGALLNCELHMNKRIKIQIRIKNALLKSCYSFFLRKNIAQIIKETHYKLLIFFAIPFGYVLYHYWYKKYRSA
ncbi:sugar transferase [Lapidilactobacillus concavus]|nr:glycosyltransferase family 2 protein [Lapidilactobacillus concavus]GEL13708.1 sugar transferase [Lapidilactobacillus concavus]